MRRVPGGIPLSMLVLALQTLLYAADVAQAAAPKDVLVDVGAQDSRLRLDIKYATADNFSGRVQYSVARCLLRPAVAKQVFQAQDLLDGQKRGMRLLLKDCYRPVSIQRALFDSVANTPKAAYVANPNRPSGAVHTFAAAVDTTLVDADGVELDMGTPYDFLGPLAEPRRAAAFLAEGKLSAAQVRNRGILTGVMRQAGFIPISNEWWHFDAWQGKALRARFAPLDIALEKACLRAE